MKAKKTDIIYWCYFDELKYILEIRSRDSNPVPLSRYYDDILEWSDERVTVVVRVCAAKSNILQALRK